MSLKAKPRLEIKLLIFWFWQYDLSFLSKMIDGLYLILTKDTFLRV
jgi:hypothetical protein